MLFHVSSVGQLVYWFDQRENGTNVSNTGKNVLFNPLLLSIWLDSRMAIHRLSPVAWQSYSINRKVNNFHQITDFGLWFENWKLHGNAICTVFIFISMSIYWNFYRNTQEITDETLTATDCRIYVIAGAQSKFTENEVCFLLIIIIMTLKCLCSLSVFDDLFQSAVVYWCWWAKVVNQKLIQI